MRTPFMRHASGYTVVELVISISVFTILVSIASGNLIQAFRAQRQIAALIAANNNASLTIEQMAREIRTGLVFPPGGAGPALTFTNALQQEVTYRENGGAIERKVGTGASLPITADNVIVRTLTFFVYVPSNFPPRVIISLGVSPKQEKSVRDVVVNIATTISPRF